MTEEMIPQVVASQRACFPEEFLWDYHDLMLAVGLQLTGVIKDYMRDRESHNAAAVLEWQR
jgi:hypothetical protein